MPKEKVTAQEPVKEAVEYEKRVMSMKLAVSHSRNCQASTLVKLADTIYDFLCGKKSKPSSE